jgi:glucokinase
MPEPAKKPELSIVLADVGGTNVRFALLTGERMGEIEYRLVRDFPHFADALAAFLARNNVKVGAAVLAAAGVVQGERCALTNNSWVVDGAELCARFGFSRVRVVNDFEAIAWSLPHLDHKELHSFGGRETIAGAPKLALGPGTGLGIAAYVPREKQDFVLGGEGGHGTMPGASPREDAIIAHLRTRFDHVSAERVISGSGLENLYRAIAAIDGATVPERDAAAITQAALEGSCPVSRAAIDTFCAMLGDVAGNFALLFGARGGVYIAGGIVPRLRDYLSQTRFRARFEAKGRLRFYLEPIPVYVIRHTEPAFVGLRALAAQY